MLENTYFKTSKMTYYDQKKTVRFFRVSDCLDFKAMNRETVFIMIVQGDENVRYITKI